MGVADWRLPTNNKNTNPSNESSVGAQAIDKNQLVIASRRVTANVTSKQLAQALQKAPTV